MARILASGAAAGATASASMGPSWLFGLCVFVVSVWVVSFAVFICGHSHHDEDRPKKKPAPPAKASRVAARSGTVVGTSGMYVAAYAGCTGGHHHGGHHHTGGGCGGGGHHGGGGCGGGGGGGGGGCGGGC